MRMKRLKERAVILPIVAFILLTPPILLIFNSSTLIFGMPILYIYAFSICIILMLTWRALGKDLLALKLSILKMHKYKELAYQN